MISYLLVLVGALLIAAAIAFGVRARMKKTNLPDVASTKSAPRSVALAFDGDDLRHTEDPVEATGPVEVVPSHESDPDDEDPFLKAVREERKETVSEAVPVAVVQPHESPLTFASPVAAIPVIPEEDDGPVDFSGLGALGNAERERLLQELDATLNRDSVEAEMSVHDLPSPSSDSVVPAADLHEHDVVQELRRTYRWVGFMGPDAQSLGDAERENLILMLRNMHDAWCLPVLMSAFEEESSDGLRPRVLEALIHSYHGAHLEETLQYCIEFGSSEEKRLAESAVAALLVAV